ncbi:MAG: Brix domain-containing protein [Nitrososphaerota archaeon]
MSMRTLCRDLANAIPGLIRVNRGKMSLFEVAERASQLGAEKIAIIDRWQGGPGRINLFKRDGDTLVRVTPSIDISQVLLQRDLGATRKRIHSVFIDGTDRGGQEIKALQETLSDFFRIPVIDPNKASAQFEAAIRISPNSRNRLRLSFYALPESIEIGPRITISHVEWAD